MFIASVRPSVCLSETKIWTFENKNFAPFEKADVTGSAKRRRKTKFGPTFYVFYLQCTTTKLDKVQREFFFSL